MEPVALLVRPHHICSQSVQAEWHVELREVVQAESRERGMDRPYHVCTPEVRSTNLCAFQHGRQYREEHRYTAIIRIGFYADTESVLVC